MNVVPIDNDPALDEPNFNLRATLDVLRRQFRLILLTVILFLGGATLAIFALKPIFTASTLVLVDPSRKNLLDPTTQSAGTASDSARVESEVELVTSESTLLRVVEEASLVSNLEFGVKLGLKSWLLDLLQIQPAAMPGEDEVLQEVLSNLRQAISVQRRGLTYLILIEARSADPETAANIANTLANAYISEQIEAKVRSVLASRDTIQPRVADASATLVAAEQAFDKFLASNIEEIAAATGRTDLVELRALLEDSSLQNARIQAKAELVDRSLSRKDWQAVTESLQSATLQSLDAQRQALANDLAAATEGSQRFDLRAKLAEVETSMDQAANAELTSLRQQLIASQAKTSDLRVQLRTSVLQSDLPAEITTEIYGLQQNAELSRVQYQSLLGRLQELDVQAYLQVPDSRVVSEALPPFRPSFPNPQLMLTLAGMAGLALGIGLAFLYENFVGGFTSVEQVQSVLRVPVATSVPLQRGGRRSRSGSDVGGVAQLVVDAPLSIFAESIRHIRVGLDRALRRRRKQPRIGYVVMVSSAAPHEGKTTVALSLARTYALSGRSTVLIDCDLRKPTVHRHLGIEPARGLLEVLHDKSGITSLDSILQVDLATGVRIAPGARRSELATDHLIAGKEFAELLRTVTESYDIVVLDTPPVGPVVDGLYLAQFADAIAFVVKWSSTSQQDAKSALTALRDAKRPGVTILGVLNQLQITKSAERSKYAGYYEDV